MQLHHHIIHHVRRHTEHIIAHVNKHHKKYILGAGILSGIGIFKLIGIIAIFFGVTYMGGGTSLGGDYYDAEYYQQEAAKKVSITTESITGCNLVATGNSTSSATGNCPAISK